jgi:hypothetical protein
MSATHQRVDKEYNVYYGQPLHPKPPPFIIYQWEAKNKDSFFCPFCRTVNPKPDHGKRTKCIKCPCIFLLYGTALYLGNEELGLNIAEQQERNKQENEYRLYRVATRRARATTVRDIVGVEHETVPEESVPVSPIVAMRRAMRDAIAKAADDEE